MTRSLIISYQWLTGISDSVTGILLCVAPVFALQSMRLSAPADATAYIAYIGAFVFSVGLAGICGAVLMHRHAPVPALEMVWMLTALTRASVAIFVTKAVLMGQLDPTWIYVAAFDGLCVLIQTVGLRMRWLKDAL
ncbi:MAG: hypothetical protein KGN79_03670 [Acidobacteriota bacterium]|nr:hypothetical protein [Acidobacteriota bacterium]